MRNWGKMAVCIGLAAVLAAAPTQGQARIPDESPPSIEIVPQAPVIEKKLAVVIDDFGNDMRGTEETIELPIPLTVAVMPFLPTTKRDAEWAHAKGKPVFVHMPMEPKHGRRSWLGPGAITVDLEDDEIRKRVEAAIDDVPYAEGINNHMGSKATGNERVMRIVLQVCKERGLVFLDSKTNYRSVAGTVARELGVKYVANELFFDDVPSAAHVRKQVGEVSKKLEVQDTCVVIGHVGMRGKYTAEVLKASIPGLKRQATFVPVRDLAK